eukprot:Gregarina_sp_Poly_1__2263@NODE_1600_length_3746_cov_138_343028_g1054_i0_p3_GENE_NODE_1600_length_3746_cov_138_343028_g1054_i0NODE_1600_length_3746_cov_138_343028_g1054_i0_p3_ORF_typecomplete_len109_score10_87_NODE_1600_length_3746_cov_138_343028_g1054_i0231557
MLHEYASPAAMQPRPQPLQSPFINVRPPIRPVINSPFQAPPPPDWVESGESLPVLTPGVPAGQTQPARNYPILTHPRDAPFQLSNISDNRSASNPVDCAHLSNFIIML